MRKRIAHVTFDMRAAGAEKVIYNLITGTDRSKYDVSVICLEKTIGTFGRRLEEKGYKLVPFGRRPGFDISLIKKIREYIKANQIDILHCHQYTPYIYGVLASAFTGKKVLFTEHGRLYPDQRRMKRVLINPVLNLFTDHITAISSATRCALSDVENLPYDRIEVIYNGIYEPGSGTSEDNELKRSLGIDDKARIIGTVARLDPIKNQAMMIRALDIVLQKRPGIVLVMVGDGPERNKLEKLSKEMGLSSSVVFTGFREDIHRFLKIMDIFLLTSFTEGTAMTLLEAMAMGLPCIVTDVGGNPEIVLDGETGFLVPSGDHGMLADKIDLLFDNNDLMDKIRRAARRRFEDNFTVDRMVRAYEDIYDGKRNR